MKLRLERDTFTAISTTGALFIDGAQFCWTLEPVVKDGLPGSAIPEGTYKIELYLSHHFRRIMPLLVDVPNRSEIEIHWGNTADDTRGCILLGGSRPGRDYIGQSRQIWDDFWYKAYSAIQMKDCTIEIVNLPPAELNLQGDT